MNDVHPLRFWDRSRATTDWTCPRKRFWNYEFMGRGIVSPALKLALFEGLIIHDCVAAMAQAHKDGSTLDVTKLAQRVYEQMVEALGSPDSLDTKEQATLMQGMVLGFYKHVWPRLLAQYPKVLHIEKELTMPGAAEGSHLRFMSKPDLLLMSEDESEVVYPEWKTTGTKRENWINSWDTAVQLHSTIRAIKHDLGIDVTQVIVQGLYKGSEVYGKLSTPFVYGYKKEGQPPMTRDRIDYEWFPGSKKFPVWDLPSGVEGWVNSMPENVLADQFPQSPPIFINDPLVDAFIRQQELRELAIEGANQMLVKYENDPEMVQYVMDATFPQRFDQCRPPYRKDGANECEYKQLCHERVLDPFALGFSFREAHHQPEKDQHDNGA